MKSLLYIPIFLLTMISQSFAVHSLTINGQKVFHTTNYDSFTISLNLEEVGASMDEKIYLDKNSNGIIDVSSDYLLFKKFNVASDGDSNDADNSVDGKYLIKTNRVGMDGSYILIFTDNGISDTISILLDPLPEKVTGQIYRPNFVPCYAINEKLLSAYTLDHSASSVMINYNVLKAASVKIHIFSLKGKLISTVTNNYKQPGYYRIVWNGNSQSTGLYTVRYCDGIHSEIANIVISR